jgi:hypothetical protein
MPSREREKTAAISSGLSLESPAYFISSAEKKSVIFFAAVEV